jgi:hypothetical protein
MADMTNITDFDPATGRTTTTLVTGHDRGALEWAEQEAYDDHGGGSGPAPTLVSAAPPTVSAASPSTTITLTGTGFIDGANARVNGNQQTTEFVSATSLKFNFNPTAAGTVQLSVRNPDGKTSANLAFVVATLVEDPALATIEEIKTYLDDGHDDLADEVLAAEEARGDQARATLISWLQGFIAARDED